MMMKFRLLPPREVVAEEAADLEGVEQLLQVHAALGRPVVQERLLHGSVADFEFHTLKLRSLSAKNSFEACEWSSGVRESKCLKYLRR